MQIQVDRAFDPELLIREFPGALSFHGAAPGNPGTTVITGTGFGVTYDGVLRILDRCFIDSTPFGDSTVQVVVRRRLAIVSGVGLFLGGLVSGVLGAILVF